MQDFRKLVDICRGKTVYIQTHNFPDPDAIASAFGLQRLLARFGIETSLCYDGKIDKLSASKMLTAFPISMYSAAEAAEFLRPEDYIICVDSQKSSGNMTDFTGEEVAAIDHHPTYTAIDYLYSDIQIVGACATLITEYYESLGLIPDPDAASALLYGIKMDTLDFTRGVTERDIQAFAFLFPYADSEKLSSLERNNLLASDLVAYGAAIEHIYIQDYAGFSSIPFACPDAMIAILSDFILSLVEVEVAVIYCNRPDGIRFSVRSERKDVHAGALIHSALSGIGDGGGHAEMAGGLIPAARKAELGGDPDGEIRRRFLEIMGL